jgi:glycosyltransferase involved in cell wall biosynthesis
MRLASARLVYNRKEYLEATMRSVVNQCYPKLE